MFWDTFALEGIGFSRGTPPTCIPQNNIYWTTFEVGSMSVFTFPTRA